MSRTANLWFPPLVLSFALIPLGAQPPVALYLVLMLISAGFCAFGVRALAYERAAATDMQPFTKPATGFLLALPVYVVLQLIVQMASGYSDGPAYAVSESALELVALALFYVLVYGACSDSRAFRALLGALALIGGAEATYGVLNLLAGNHTLLIWKRWIFFDSATGTLSSRNHFAYLMEMLLPVAIAFAIICGRDAGRQANAQTSEHRARTALIGTIAMVSGLGLIFSHSRMGILSFALAVSAVFALDRWVRPSHDDSGRTERRGLPIVAIGVAVMALGLAAAIGLDSVLERFLRVDNDFVSGRLPIWRAALGMFAAHPVIGNGWGTFQSLLPAYRIEPNGFYYTHAHNDYLEVLAEGGVVGFAIVVILLAMFARRLTEVLATSLSHTQRSTVRWLAVAISSTLIHSLADYGLRVPGVALTFVAVTALFTRMSETPALATRRSRSRSHRSKSRAA
jgi:O-antigen ligase